jgi:hypothetical protein
MRKHREKLETELKVKEGKTRDGVTNKCQR